MASFMMDLGWESDGLLGTVTDGWWTSSVEDRLVVALLPRDTYHSVP